MFSAGDDEFYAVIGDARRHSTLQCSNWITKRISGVSDRLLTEGPNPPPPRALLLADIRGNPPRLTIKLSPAQLIARISLAAGPCRPVGPFPETPYESFRSGHKL